jgi:N-acetylmuramoyl-L-alanine amidase
MFTVLEHQITGPNVRYHESPNRGAKFAPNLPDSIVLHYTAGPDALTTIQYLCNPNTPNPVSAHLVVGRDNSITQLVPFDTVAWHAGNSSYNGRSGYNNYSIGIEIDNAGELTKTGDVYRSCFNKDYPVEEVAKLTHRNEIVEKFWHVYPSAQIQIVRQVCNLLCNTYVIRSILGHEEISPGRKIDPGPAFPLDELRNLILSRDEA